jgi:DNA polymerase bacteriophage-type
MTSLVCDTRENFNPTILHLDVETRSSLNLQRVGTSSYAADESTEILCAAYAVDDGPVQLWTPGAPVPPEIITAASEPEWRIAAHNSNFEYQIVNRLLAPRFGWPAVPIAKFDCTMARARAAALPGSLDGAAAALGLDVRKDKTGAKLMRVIATRKLEHPTVEQVEHLYAYCKRDVEVERALHHRLPPLTDAEQALWVLDHQINQRGLPIDRELAVATAELAKQQRLAVNSEIAALTNGQVLTANQCDRMIRFLATEGCSVAGLTKADVKKALKSGPSDSVQKLLELRAIGSQAAATKVATLLGGLDSDDRLRETLVYHGAATGRWSGRRFQPQNLKKAAKTLDIDAAIAAIKSGDLARVAALGAPLSIAADVSRGLICAPPGHVLVGADFSAIESRVLAWLAGEKWKLQSYAKYDQTGDPVLEPYCQTASKILGRTVTPDDEEGRGVGKVADLACGYGGGVGAWKRFPPRTRAMMPKSRQTSTAGGPLTRTSFASGATWSAP